MEIIRTSFTVSVCASTTRCSFIIIIHIMHIAKRHQGMGPPSSAGSATGARCVPQKLRRCVQAPRLTVADTCLPRPSLFRAVSGPVLMNLLGWLLAQFNERMEQFIAEIKAVPLAKGCDEVFYPGEMEARYDEQNRRNGLALPEDTRADLARIAKLTGLETNLPC